MCEKNVQGANRGTRVLFRGHGRGVRQAMMRTTREEQGEQPATTLALGRQITHIGEP
jgi:hypothetical protein